MWQGYTAIFLLYYVLRSMFLRRYTHDSHTNKKWICKRYYLLINDELVQRRIPNATGKQENEDSITLLLDVCISVDKSHLQYCQFSTTYRVVKRLSKGQYKESRRGVLFNPSYAIEEPPSDFFFPFWPTSSHHFPCYLPFILCCLFKWARPFWK